MKNLRRQFDLFCFRNRDKGIQNLMLYIVIGSAIVYLMTQMTGNPILYNWLCFDRTKILQGQVWRLLTYALTFSGGNVLLTAVGLLCYYSLGRTIEAQWGSFRFNLYYLTGLILMDVFCLIFPVNASVTYLNMSLFLAYSTLYPDACFLLFFIIPIKAWIFALFDLALTVYSVISTLSYYAAIPGVSARYLIACFAPLVAIANYFLFFGKDVANVIPFSWRRKIASFFGRKSAPRKPVHKVIPLAPESKSSKHVKADYLHRCTVCGRTDVSNPELEFRYCSRCNGYYCYCEDHINNHAHIQ